MKKIIFGLLFLVLMTGLVFASQGSGNAQINAGSDNSEDNSLEVDNSQGMEIKNRTRAGIYTNENGEQLRIEEASENRLKIKSGEVEAECDCELEQEQVQDRIILKTKLSNGKYVEIKVMPDTASETALNMLKLKVCSEENNCSIELKEVGNGEEVRLAYELQTERNAKIMGLFKSRIQVKAQVDAESGEVIQIEKPWWAFLASEEGE